MKRFGTQSKKIAKWLRELSELELNIRSSATAEENGITPERIIALRRLIPTSMLQHYDHLKSRGKRSVAPITRGVCGSCHLAFPSGVLMSLRRTSEMLNVCVNCGAFVYLTEEEFVNGSEHVGREAKRVQSNRGSKQTAGRKRSKQRRSV